MFGGWDLHAMRHGGLGGLKFENLCLERSWIWKKRRLRKCKLPICLFLVHAASAEMAKLNQSAKASGL